MCYFKENFMVDTELSNIKYLSKAYKGLSDEKKDYLLDTARSKLKIQDATIYPANEKTVPHYEKEESAFLETSRA
jgi:hypothetical protein